MDLNFRLENVAVIGAAGKMGRGISLLIAQEMAKLKLQPENQNKVYLLNLIDVNNAALLGLRGYLKDQLIKSSEKTIVTLRGLYQARKDLVENKEIIDQFVDDALGVIRFGTDLGMVKDAHMVFEAIIEDKSTKVKVLKKVDRMCGKETFYFTNTSSIPISILDQEANLQGRIIGYHFYNPPAVQRLLELISTPKTRPDLKEFSLELAKRLRKTVVPANDIAGFIGNGHFMRDILHATSEVERLSPEFGQPGALYIINRISQEFLIRPMGIFQLVDYVGVDVCQCILKVMRKYIKGERLKSKLIDEMVEAKVIGGQNPDGSQKDGFLKYERNRPIGVYDSKKREYLLFEKEGWTGDLDKKIGNPPEGYSPWKILLGDSGREEKLKIYFANLFGEETFGANLAKIYLHRSREIGEKLVKDGVANSAADVNSVLMNGFYHLYGPINDYF